MVAASKMFIIYQLEPEVLKKVLLSLVQKKKKKQLAGHQPWEKKGSVVTIVLKYFPKCMYLIYYGRCFNHLGQS